MQTTSPHPRRFNVLVWLVAAMVTGGLTGSLTTAYANEHHHHDYNHAQHHTDHHRHWNRANRHRHHPDMSAMLLKGMHLSKTQKQVIQVLFSHFQQQRQAWMHKHGKQLHKLFEQSRSRHGKHSDTRRDIHKLMASAPQFSTVIRQIKTVVLKKNQVRQFNRNVDRMKSAWRHHHESAQYHHHADHHHYAKRGRSEQRHSHRANRAQANRHHNRYAKHGEAAARHHRWHAKHQSQRSPLDQMFAHLDLSHSQARQVRETLQKSRMQALAKIRRDVLTHRQAEQLERNLKQMHSRERHHAKGKRSHHHRASAHDRRDRDNYHHRDR